MRVLYTIGYEGTDIDRFVATLKAAKIQVLACQIASNRDPLSRPIATPSRRESGDMSARQ